MYDFAYAFAAAFHTLVWALLFVVLRQQRKLMLGVGLGLGIAGPVSEYWFLPDYWRPVYVLEIAVGPWRFGPEDFVATAALAGISAGVFEAIAVPGEQPCTTGQAAILN